MGKKLRAVLCAVVPAVVLALAAPVAAQAAGNMFLKSDALTGESVQADHAGEVEVS